MSILICSGLKAHEGHTIPGALPPPPNGGIVEEAKPTRGAEKAGEAELFLEATYREGKITLYPLLLKPENTSVYVPITPKDLQNAEVKIELPRKKTSQVLKLTSLENAFEAPFESQGANRFIVHFSATHNKTIKTAKLQIEKK